MAKKKLTEAEILALASHFMSQAARAKELGMREGRMDVPVGGGLGPQAVPAFADRSGQAFFPGADLEFEILRKRRRALMGTK